MKKLLVVAAAAALLSHPVQAMDWSGWYVGAEASRASSEQFSYITMAATQMTFWPVAFSAGYLFATDGDLHWGFEAEAGMMNMDNFVMPPGYSNFQHQRLYASLSARAGLAIDRFMPYASVGLRATSVDMAVDIAAPPGPAWRETMTGFGLNPTATIGAEFAITDTIAVKAEISHTFGSVFLTQSNGATADFYPGSSVGVGVNVRF